MKTRNIIGKRIVGVEQARVHHDETHEYLGYEVTRITLEDGTTLVPNIFETGHEYALEFIVANHKKGTQMNFVYDDGGRAKAGFKGNAGDCVVRAVTIITGLPYIEVYNFMSDKCRTQRKTRRSKRLSSARSGVYTRRKWFNDWMSDHGLIWTPTMGIGTGCRVHLRDGELPSGRLVVSLSRHLTAVIDGVIHDTYNPDRGGTRCVYGYWTLSGDTK